MMRFYLLPPAGSPHNHVVLTEGVAFWDGGVATMSPRSQSQFPNLWTTIGALRETLHQDGRRLAWDGRDTGNLLQSTTMHTYQQAIGLLSGQEIVAQVEARTLEIPCGICNAMGTKDSPTVRTHNMWLCDPCYRLYDAVAAARDTNRVALVLEYFLKETSSND